MDILKSSHYRRSRFRNKLRNALKKTLRMGLLVVVGEYMLLNVISSSLSSLEGPKPSLSYSDMTRQIVSLAVSNKPILRAARTYDSLTKTIDFDNIIQRQYPVHVRGSRPDFRALDLQDKEGAKVGYVVKF
jgi:hypothetical protein